MKIQRCFTKPGIDPLDEVRWERRESVIREPDGTVVFEMRDIEVPADWSQVATDILAQKYFRKAGVPQPDGSLGRETSARQVVRRLAGCWTDWGRRYKYFDSDEDAAAFDAEISHMLIHQMAAPNSPQWFNTGLAYAYGITGPSQGHYYVDPDTKELVRAKDSYTHPQPHACFIQSVEDDLVNDNGIMDLWVREARLFKYGSGTGTNFSNIRAEGEKLSGGGSSSGLMSFLRVGDRAAGAIKSGGTTRRAAKMVILDIDHPDIEKFINWKVEEEKKVAALIAAGYGGSYEGEAYSTVSGQNSNNSVRIPDKFVEAVRSDATWDLLWRRDKTVARTVRARDLWDQIARAAWACADPGVQYDDIINSWHTCPAGGRIRASNPCVTADTLVATDLGYRPVSELVGRQFRAIVDGDTFDSTAAGFFFTGIKDVFELRISSGLAVKATADHRFLTATSDGCESWKVLRDIRIGDRVVIHSHALVREKVSATDTIRGELELTIHAQSKRERLELVQSITPRGQAPVYDCTIPGPNAFDANGFYAHNCSEYMFLDDTACNLASINLMKFYDADRNQVDVDAFRHACRLWTMVLEISVLMAQFPSPEIARKSYEYRTLGLGYANLGTLLMVSGIPYDSPRALAITGAISAILTGESYAASAEMAREIGPFPRYKENAASMLRVMRNHRHAVYNATASEYDRVSVVPMGIDAALCPPYLLSAARECWDRALEFGEQHGYRNAQATCIAPTGCLVGNSLVITDRGIMRLGALGDVNGSKWQDVDFKVLTDEGERQATKFYLNGIEATRRITTRSGYSIQGTPAHRIKVVDVATGQLQWKRFADVGPDDIVALSMGKLVGQPRTVNLPPLGEEYWTGDYTTRVPRTMSPELAELLGYFMGDGSLHSKGLRFCVSQEDSDVVQHLVKRLKDLFNLEAAITQQTGYVEVGANSVPLAMWWEACKFSKLAPHTGHSGKGYVPRIPDAVLATNDPEIYGAFLRGLFEADGTVNGSVPSLSMKSSAFCDEVKTVMLALGIPTSTHTTISGWGKSPINVIRLRNRFYVIRFDETIGFIGDRKSWAVEASYERQAARHDRVHLPAGIVQELVPAGSSLTSAVALSMGRHEGAISRRSARQLLEETGDERLQHALEFFYDTVESNEDGGEQPTYDLSVPANVTYVANGFVSHNTIGLVMDCDTTGIEPDFALVKFKKLAGGGYFKIINQSIPTALRNFGYNEEQIEDIVRYAKGSGSLYGSPYVNAETLRARGFTNEDIINIERALPSVFEIGFGFNQWTLGEATMQRLGIPSEQYNAADFDLLPHLGFSREEVEGANNYICGTMTIEGAPHLKEEHYAVFDCANKCGKLGKRFIHHMGHVRMMSAAQPFISGALSKTVNLTNEATVDEIKETYMRSWDLGLKSIALYRDGSKLSQPLSNKGTDRTGTDNGDRQLALSEEFARQLEEARKQRADELRPDEILAAAQRILANATNTDFKRRVAQALERNRLPAKRRGWTQKAKISGHTVFLRTGEYADGTLGEIFVDLHKEGASFRSLMNCFAIAVSIGLQYGVPLEEFVDKFVFTRFEPNGFVDHPNIKHCTSVVDYIFRVLGMEYLGRTDFVQVKPEDKDVDETHHEEHAQTEFEARVNAQQVADEATPPRKQPTSGSAQPRQQTTAKSPTVVDPGVAAQLSALRSREAQMASLMGDAPLCDVCGSITRRNGACYVCDSCGRSMGCS
jgi:ribonucleoside-diphosphate reductase alpha chain